MDTDLFFARRLGYGLRTDEKLPAPAREWALDQLRTIPPYGFVDATGKDIAASVPDYGQLYATFESGAHAYELGHVAQDHVTPLAKKLPQVDYERKFNLEVSLPYWVGPAWGECLAMTLTAAHGSAGVFERFWAFWSNHFTVSTQILELGVFWGPHLRTIRQRMTGNFADLLYDAVANPAMLMYLNNNESFGPHSRKGRDPQNPFHDLNENLARELLELHSVSPAAGYTQADVTATARLLTGWTFRAGTTIEGRGKDIYGVFFDADRHEPGAVTIMGKTYTPQGDGSGMLRELVDDLAAHPATAHHIAFKLARAFVADYPSDDVVGRIEKTFVDTKGDLVAVHSAVVEEVLSAGPQPAKVAAPLTWLAQAYRLTGATVPIGGADGAGGSESVQLVCRELGQEPNMCPQPNGFSELNADWLSKQMIDRRVRQAYRIGLSTRLLSVEALTDYTARLAGTDSPLVALVQHAESRPVAIAMLLSSPQFLKI
ncbi:MAG TPA: DUF1800 family protein [Bauldia sp.]|nr:DUF1800 family protein [Bauldia sp.]